MSHDPTLHLSTPSDTEIAMRREFSAPRQLVFDAYTRPELVRRWLGVFGGHTMSTCEIDLRIGGRYRYVWRLAGGGSMGVGGEYREIVPAERIVNTERFDEAWYDGEGVGTVVFVEHAGRTTVTTTVRYTSRAVRDAVLASPMKHGVAAGYAALDRLLSTSIAAGAGVAVG
jgi:uncharacterized protein YndB with AHSA1/START domain